MKKTIINFANKTSEEIEMSAEEETSTLENHKQTKLHKEKQDLANKQKEVDKANGNTKLLDLGLTQAEATALTGYSIPVVSEEDPE